MAGKVCNLFWIKKMNYLTFSLIQALADTYSIIFYAIVHTIETQTVFQINNQL